MPTSFFACARKLTPALLIGACGMFSQAQAACDFSAASTKMQALLATDGITDGGLLIGSPQGIWFEQFYGTYTDATVIPIASASKMLSGVRIMQLVDRGVLDLDRPVSSYLSGANFPWSATAAPITLRQMFSHTAGYGDDESDPVLSDRSINLVQAAAEIASNYQNLSPQNYLPVGSQFAYGGVAMQIGGAAAQVHSGVDWQAGWKSDIGAPMCISTIDWQGLGATTNYRIAGSVRTNIGDYARVLAMLANGGVGNGRRILSGTAIATMNHSQIGDATVGYIPPAADANTKYGIGAWIEPLPTSASLDTPVIESIGAFGFTPWVDFSNATFGIIMVADNAPGRSPGSVSRATMTQLVALIRAELDANGGRCAATQIVDELFVDEFGDEALAAMCPAIVAAPQS